MAARDATAELSGIAAVGRKQLQARFQIEVEVRNMRRRFRSPPQYMTVQSSAVLNVVDTNP
jgi:hypothetical protein